MSFNLFKSRFEGVSRRNEKVFCYNSSYGNDSKTINSWILFNRSVSYNTNISFSKLFVSQSFLFHSSVNIFLDHSPVQSFFPKVFFDLLIVKIWLSMIDCNEYVLFLIEWKKYVYRNIFHLGILLWMKLCYCTKGDWYIDFSSLIAIICMIS